MLPGSGLSFAMRYQLVLQFRGDTLADYDAMISLEDQLRKELGHSADVDGHDCGADETNIFIFTSDPKATFWRIRQLLQREGKMESVAAAFREISGETYTVLWPEGQTEFRIA